MSGECSVCDAQSTSCPGFKPHKFKANICMLCEHAESAHNRGNQGDVMQVSRNKKSNPIYDSQPAPPPDEDDIPPPPPDDDGIIDLTKPKAMNIPSGQNAPTKERKTSNLKSAIPIPEEDEDGKPSPTNKKSLDMSISASGAAHRLNPKAPLTVAPPLSVEMSSRYSSNPVVLEKRNDFELSEESDNEVLKSKSVYWIPENKSTPIELNITDASEIPEEGKIEKENENEEDQDDIDDDYYVKGFCMDTELFLSKGILNIFSLLLLIEGLICSQDKILPDYNVMIGIFAFASMNMPRSANKNTHIWLNICCLLSLPMDLIWYFTRNPTTYEWSVIVVGACLKFLFIILSHLFRKEINNATTRLLHTRPLAYLLPKCGSKGVIPLRNEDRYTLRYREKKGRMSTLFLGHLMSFILLYVFGIIDLVIYKSDEVMDNTKGGLELPWIMIIKGSFDIIFAYYLTYYFSVENYLKPFGCLSLCNAKELYSYNRKKFDPYILSIIKVLLSCFSIWMFTTTLLVFHEPNTKPDTISWITYAIIWFLFIIVDLYGIYELFELSRIERELSPIINATKHIRNEEYENKDEFASDRDSYDEACDIKRDDNKDNNENNNNNEEIEIEGKNTLGKKGAPLPGYPPIILPYSPGSEIEGTKLWRLCEDDQHLRYYYNVSTGESQYYNPMQYISEKMLLGDYTLDDASFEKLWNNLPVLCTYCVKLIRSFPEDRLCDILQQHHFLIIATGTRDNETKIYAYTRYWDDTTYYLVEFTFEHLHETVLIISKCQNPTYLSDFMELLPIDELTHGIKPVCRS